MAVRRVLHRPDVCEVIDRLAMTARLRDFVEPEETRSLIAEAFAQFGGRLPRFRLRGR